jgi:hypothetical protein
VRSKLPVSSYCRKCNRSQPSELALESQKDTFLDSSLQSCVINFDTGDSLFISTSQYTVFLLTVVQKQEDFKKSTPHHDDGCDLVILPGGTLFASNRKTSPLHCMRYLYKIPRLYCGSVNLDRVCLVTCPGPISNGTMWLFLNPNRRCCGSAIPLQEHMITSQCT